MMRNLKLALFAALAWALIWVGPIAAEEVAKEPGSSKIAAVAEKLKQDKQNQEKKDGEKKNKKDRKKKDKVVEESVSPPENVPVEEPAEEPQEKTFAATHEEIDAITIPAGEDSAEIHTFCVTPDGKLLASCGGTMLSYVRGEDGSLQLKEIKVPASIKVLDKDGTLIDTWALDVTPQGLGVAPDGTIYVGGQGKISKLSPEGKVLATVDAPQVADLPPLPELPPEDEEELDEEAAEAKQEQIAKLREQLTKQSTELREAWTATRDVKDAQEKLAAQDKFQKIMDAYQETQTKLRELTTNKRTLAIQARNAAMRKYAVNGIAAGEKDVFVACPQATGYGYAVYRMSRDLTDAKQIVTGLRGCCGQMDIQTYGGDVFAANNSAKKVVQYDRDGEKINEFGSTSRGGAEGFGSCCNPMNIRFDSEGLLYTAEASVGRVKTYKPDGELVDVVGTATIVPGCKHVTIGVLGDGQRVYMLDITRKRIVVLVRKAG